MKCSDLQFELSLYDGRTDEAENAGLREHLGHCPVCREQLGEFRSIKNDLKGLNRPVLTSVAVGRIRSSVVAEARSGRSLVAPAFRRWVEFQLMPYGVGAAVSVIIGFGFLTMMFSGIFQPDLSVASRRNVNSAVMLADSFDPNRVSGPDVVSPAEFARDRVAFAGESPSVNPQGALMALTRSVMRGEMRDEEVVIVADVFGNGLARISEVVEPDDDDKIVQELRKALDTDPARAPFLPSSFENRPESVRVVFMLQSVNVSTRDRRGRARL